MFRVVVFILVALQTLTPPGVCLRNLGGLGSITQTATSTVPDCCTAKAEQQHPVGCGCGCQGRRAEGRTAAAGGGTTPESLVRVCDDAPAQPTGPCHDSSCWASCKAKSDKIVHQGNPQVEGEVVVTWTDWAAPVHLRLRHQDRPLAVATAPPLYVAFCSFLI